MRLTLAALLLIALLAPGCAQPLSGARVDHHTIAPTDVSGAIEGRTTLGQAVPIPGQHAVLVPFAVETWKGWFQRDDPYQRSGYSADRLSVAAPRYDYSGRLGSNVRWHNAILHDLSSGDQWPILTQRGVISQWHVFGKQPHAGPGGRGEETEPFTVRALLFIATLDDANKDGLLDDRDARVAIVTNADGRNPRIVTPRDAQVGSVFYEAEADLIFLRTATDTNNDGQFNFDDEAMPMVLSLKDPAARPLVSAECLRRVQALLGPTPTGTPRAGN